MARNPFLKHFKTFLTKHVSKGSKELKRAMNAGPGLIMFILGRFMAASCLRNQIQIFDPTNELAIEAVL